MKKRLEKRRVESTSKEAMELDHWRVRAAVGAVQVQLMLMRWYSKVEPLPK